jgi:long-chain acyl-CoA synthetase
MNSLSEFRFGSVGRPLGSNTVKIADDGEVLVKGAGVFSGYIGETTAGSSVDEDGFLHTGDLGTLEADGKLVLVGRKSEIFKTSTGRKIAPVQIESKLIRIAGVDHAVILGAGQKLLVAILAPAIETATSLNDESSFRDFALAVAKQIDGVLADEPDYCRPSGLVVRRRSFSIDNGELTSNLKLRRKIIQEKYDGAVQSLYAKFESRSNDDQDFIEVLDPDTIILNSRAVNQ